MVVQAPVLAYILVDGNQAEVRLVVIYRCATRLQNWPGVVLVEHPPAVTLSAACSLRSPSFVDNKSRVAFAIGFTVSSYLHNSGSSRGEKKSADKLVFTCSTNLLAELWAFYTVQLLPILF